MILVLCTSSPVVSVAAFDLRGSLLMSSVVEAPRAAGKACLELLDEWGGLDQVTGIVADVGPGSFTGVRVGVTLAKTLAWARQLKTASVSAFDLILGDIVAIPARKGAWLVRSPHGLTLESSVPEGAAGYGVGFSRPQYPLASRTLVASLSWSQPELLLPDYHLAPSISTPKTPYLPGAIRD